MLTTGKTCAGFNRSPHRIAQDPTRAAAHDLTRRQCRRCREHPPPATRLARQYVTVTNWLVRPANLIERTFARSASLKRNSLAKK